MKALFIGVLLFLFACIVRSEAQTDSTQTTAPQNYYVSAALGDNANTCANPIAPSPVLRRMGPCKTIQGALDKIPKRLRHVVTVTVAPGNYDGFVVEGFEVNPSWTHNGAGAGLLIQGATRAASPKTGTASGAVSKCIGGGHPDPNTHASLTDLNQHWTPHDPNLRGRKLCVTVSQKNVNNVIETWDQCLAIEDNSDTAITLAGYWDDFHQPDWKNCEANNPYSITEPDTHLDTPVPLPQGIGGRSQGQAQLPDPSIAAILVSNVHGGASAMAGNGQAADNFQILLKDFDVLADDWKGGHVVHSVAFVDSSDHVAFKHFTTGISNLNPNQPKKGMYAGSGLFTFRNSTAWTVQSSYANGDAPTSPSSPMISCSRSATADTWVGVFGNVVDNMPAYFGDSVQAQTSCASSVIFGGESIRNTGGSLDGQSSPAAIQIQSAALVHFVGTKINGSLPNPVQSPPPQCTTDNECKAWNNPQNPGHCVIPQRQQTGTCDAPVSGPYTADCIRLGDSRLTSGGGTVNFEGGDFSNCSGSGIRLAGHWIATFINVPITSAASPNFVRDPNDPTKGWYNGIDGANRRWGIEAANGARVFGLGCASQGLSETSPCDAGINPLRGIFHPVDFSFDSASTGFSSKQVRDSPGQTITDPQRGGLFSFGGGEAISATSAVPPNSIGFTQGVVYGFTSQRGPCYATQSYDHVIAMSTDDPLNPQRTVAIPGGRPQGTHYVIIDTSGATIATHTITVSVKNSCDPNSPVLGLINGAPTASITPGTNKALEIISDGKNYWIISLR